MRYAEINRKTNETDISLKLSIDGKGKSEVDTGCGFLDHMLTLFSRHGDFDLDISCRGDYFVDFHHTVEDVGICLGKAFCDAAGDLRGIRRYGSMLLPMDEALVLTATDISGRACLCYDLQIPTDRVGDFDTELVEEFMQAFVRNFPITLHIKSLSGTNSHHIIEAGFKSLARSLNEALSYDQGHIDDIPSTKGILL